MNVLQAMVVATVVATQVVAAEQCAGTADEAYVWVAGRLDEAAQARGRGDFDESNELLHRAATGFLRTADISLPSRCMGSENWQRYLAETKLTSLQLGRRAELLDSVGDGSGRAFKHYTDGDNRADVARLLKALPDEARSYSSAGNRIQEKLSGYQWAVDNGFSLLAEESAGREFFTGRLGELIEVSRSRSDEIMRVEQETIDGAVTDEEVLVASIEQNATAILGAIAGDDAMLPANEARQDVVRARRSRGQLTEARDWLAWIDDESEAPVLWRAAGRGDVLLGRAEDQSLSLEARDDYFAAAIRYFELAEEKEKIETAASSRKAIEAALKAERATRSARMEQKASEFQEKADIFQQSLEKSDAEKSDFESEADALEAELDF